MYFDKFSHEAAEMFLISQREAENLGHRMIDPEHILLSICKVPSNIVFDLLINDYDVEYDVIREEVIKSLGKASRDYPACPRRSRRD